MIKIAILASGTGTNTKAIIDYFKHHDILIDVFSDKEDALALKKAREMGKKARFLAFEDNFDFFSKNPYDLYVLAGYMRILPKEVLSLGTFINIHPSLLPAFKGKNAIKRAYDYGVKVSGVTIHYVSEEVDAGKIIAQQPINIDLDMSLMEFEEKIHKIEHFLYPLVIESLSYDKIIDFNMYKKEGDCACKCSS